MDDFEDAQKRLTALARVANINREEVAKVARPLLMEFGTRQGWSFHDTDDAVNATLLQLSQHLGRYNPALPFAPYLFDILNKRYADGNRKRRPTPVSLIPSDSEVVGCAGEPPPHVYVINNETAGLIRERALHCWQQLKIDQAMLLILARGTSHADVLVLANDMDTFDALRSQWRSLSELMQIIGQPERKQGEIKNDLYRAKMRWADCLLGR